MRLAIAVGIVPAAARRNWSALCRRHGLSAGVVAVAWMFTLADVLGLLA